jgi:hypothetical protein
LNVVCQIKRKFTGKEIKEVVEFVENNEVSYSIRIEDDTNSWVIEALTNGDVRDIVKFKKLSAR